MGGGKQPPGHVGGGGGESGGNKSTGGSKEIGGSNTTVGAGSEENEEVHAPLTVSPWGTQKSAARGLRMGTRASRSGGGKVTSGTANRGETQ